MRSGVLITTILFLALFAVCEVGLSYPVPGWLYLLVSVAFGAALLQAPNARELIWRCVASVIVILTACTLYFVDWTTRKPFLRDLHRVQAGMTEVEVRAIMGRYMEGTGWPAIPGSPSSAAGTLRIAGSANEFPSKHSASGELVLPNRLVFRHSNEGSFNSDWGIVSFTNGKVVGVEFSPD